MHAPWATKRPIETMGGVAKMPAAGLCWLLLLVGVVLAFGVAASPETHYDFVVS
jgi:laccase